METRRCRFEVRSRSLPAAPVVSGPPWCAVLPPRALTSPSPTRKLEPSQALAAAVAASGGAASSHRLDVASSRQVSAVLDDVEASVTLAVTAAGIFDTFPFLELPDEFWDRTLEVNLKGRSPSSESWPGRC